MKSFYLLLLWIGGWLGLATLFSCSGVQREESLWRADSLNGVAYEARYKSLDASERAAREALSLGGHRSSVKAEALNNLAFCAFIRMDFERADSLLAEVYRETSNELECLVADIGRMKICQRTAQNKEFYDCRNSAMKRIRRIGEDEAAMKDADIRRRFVYARSEFAITSSIYYYYLQQEKQSLEAIDEIEVEELEKDTAQLLYYYYMKGSGGLYEADTPEEVMVGEFDYLMDCLSLSYEGGYVYFEANAMQALAELLKEEKNFRTLSRLRPGMMRVINQKDLPWEVLTVRLAETALQRFSEYGDWYQSAGTCRTLASCYNEQGDYEKSLEYLSEALDYVNRHHEKFYHCHDTLDRLKPYIPMATHSIELQWINQEGIMTVPEWIARFREQLSVTYAALGMKPQSDYNRNIYLDILDYTRQDKELESRYAALEAESAQLNLMLGLVVLCLLLMIVLLGGLNRRWRKRNKMYTDKLEAALDICRKITSSVSSDAEDSEDVAASVLNGMKEKIRLLAGVQDMEIRTPEQEAGEEAPEGYVTAFPLETSDKRPLGEWRVYTPVPLKKEDRSLLQIMVPYIAWTLQNGVALISLGDERKLLEKERYIHARHLQENKRQNLIKKACFFLVTGIMPYIDRVVNEVHKLISLKYLEDPAIKQEKYRYIAELTARINEYNDILALWIKMRQGSLNLNIENFGLNPLFDVLQKGRRNFELKRQTLTVEPTTAVVKADKALTLFMINTLTENARKYTQQGGEVKVYAREAEDYVEISVSDNGPGLSPEDVQCILGEKVYDSGKIGMQTATDAEALQKSKGSGFGLMNCKGIIEKYRKTNALFRVCGFFIDSRMGEGSRFYFRLPKGVRHAVGLLALLCLSVGYGCSGHPVEDNAEVDSPWAQEAWQQDSLLNEANRLANKVYDANLVGQYQDAWMYADSAFACLNEHYCRYSGKDFPLLALAGEGEAAELTWFENRFDTDYYTLLDVRNEAAVACLALGVLEAYHYNNQAYTALYKQISEDLSLEEYCRQMQQSASNKMVAIGLCVALLLTLLLGYYWLYFRHRLTYRYNLEQVLEVNRRALQVPLFGLREGKEIASALVRGLFDEVNELMALDVLAVAVYSEEEHGLCYAFSSETDDREEMQREMLGCFRSNVLSWKPEKAVKCLPLCVETGDGPRCLGVLALRRASDTGREDDRLMSELVAGYVSILIYNAVELVEQKYRDIEVAQDEARRLQREANQLYVQNMVLDNCLSTIKHETVYYPHKIKQIIDRLAPELSREDEYRQVETIGELIAYYKDVFTILSSCAARQLEEVTFRRSVVPAAELAEAATRYFQKTARRRVPGIALEVKAEEVRMIGDVVQLKFLLENLINEAVAHPEPGLLELHIYREGAFVRLDFIDRRRQLSQEELNLLFYPHLSRMRQEGGELAGTEYLICKQVVRDHDEFTGRRGCRMNADAVPGGGFRVWCTIPAK